MSLCAAGTEMLNIDVSIKDVNPRGATPWYASPEVLRSLKLKAEGARDDEEAVLVNGCLADRWSFACILFEMLTGEKLFEPEDEEGLIPPQAPPQVPKCRQQQWLLYDAIAEAQRDWVGCSPPPHCALHLSLVSSAAMHACSCKVQTSL